MARELHHGAYLEDARASPQATRAGRRRIKELERDLLRKDRALAETAVLLVLLKNPAEAGFKEILVNRFS